jgi:hypothetical protein
VLKDLGYQVDVGGSPSPQKGFSAAVSLFQERYSLAERDGRIGPVTYKAAIEALCRTVEFSGDGAASKHCEWPTVTGSQFALRYDFVSGTKQILTNAARNAMDIWEKTGVVKFWEKGASSPVGTPTAGQFFIEGPGAKSTIVKNMGLNSIGFATFPCDVQREYKVCHFDTVKSWSIGQSGNEFNATNVALHELGHILGLVHSGSSGDIMYNSFIDNEAPKGLSSNDIGLLRQHYGFP